MQPVSEADSHAFIFPVRVYYEDTDAAGVVYYANYLRFIERARTEWLRSLGFGQERLARDTGIAFVVRAVSAEYLRPARLDDRLEVVSSIASLGRAQMEFDQRIRRGDETLLTSRVRVACLELARMKPVALPQELTRALRAIT